VFKVNQHKKSLQSEEFSPSIYYNSTIVFQKIKNLKI